MAGVTTLIFAGTAMAMAHAGGLAWDRVQTPHSISFFPLGVCGNGETAYYGLVNPTNVEDPDKLFIEIMGGAMCFNRASCLDRGLGDRTMSLDKLLTEHMGVPANMIATFKSGYNVPLSMMQTLGAGFLPFEADHPFAGRRGLYVTACTGDIMLGRRNVTYTDHEYTDARTDCDETLAGPQGADYRGCQNRTRSGLPCQKWTSQTPHQHDVPISAANGIGDHNYCRKPEINNQDRRTIWCFTDLEGVTWDHCSPVGQTGDLEALHLGGKTMGMLLHATREDFPHLTEIAIVGASGGGVSASAWLANIADMWPNATVLGLVDSGLHVMPGTSIFDYFYEQSPWGPGPIGRGAGLDESVEVPNFDWRVIDALSSVIASYDGRVKIAHLSCLDDDKVYTDRKRLASYADLHDTIAVLADPDRQHDATWSFLANLETCAPPGTAFSYINQCTGHHQTATSWQTAIPGTVSPKEFVYNFINGLPPDASDPTKHRFWCQQPTIGEATCPSGVRRRRGPAGNGNAHNRDVSGARVGLGSPSLLLGFIGIACLSK